MQLTKPHVQIFPSIYSNVIALVPYCLSESAHAGSKYTTLQLNLVGKCHNELIINISGISTNITQRRVNTEKIFFDVTQITGLDACDILGVCLSVAQKKLSVYHPKSYRER